MKNKSVYFLAVALIIGLGFGLFVGQMSGQKAGTAQAEMKYKPLVDSAFPPPPPSIGAVSGVVKNVYGGAVTLEINDPNDYLPHLDGTPVKKLTVTAEVYASTKLNSVDYSKTDKKGDFEVAEIKLDDLKVGSAVRVLSSSNIKDADKFDATEIDLIIK
jgi:hypothetical protein